MKAKTVNMVAMGVVSIALTGCEAVKDAIDEAGVTVNVVGNLSIDGDEPDNRTVTLYTPTDNPDAFDSSACMVDGMEVPGCSGRIDVSLLDTPVDQGATTWSGDSFTVEDVSLSSDLGFIAVLTGSGNASCTQDIIGFDQTTKLVTLESMVTLSIDLSDPTATDVTEFTMPRDGQIRCEAPVTEPTPPPEEEVPPPEEPAEEAIVDEETGRIGGDGVGWTAFTISDGSATADASAEAVTSDANPISCSETDGIAPVLNLQATTDNTDLTEAFVRIQVGAPDDGVPVYLTDRVKVSGGNIDWDISLPGGYAVVQVDTNEDLDGEGESFTIEFCQPEELPPQELWVNTTWDKDDTDIDTHVTELGSMEEVAYYSASRSWGSLDLDVIYGYGPENVKSGAGYSSSAGYEVKIHYYSDHGNGPTDTTVRVVYVDPDSGEVCDIIATQTMEDVAGDDWWTVGTFGPGLACPE